MVDRGGCNAVTKRWLPCKWPYDTLFYANERAINLVCNVIVRRQVIEAKLIFSRSVARRIPWSLHLNHRNANWLFAHASTVPVTVNKPIVLNVQTPSNYSTSSGYFAFDARFVSAHRYVDKANVLLSGPLDIGPLSLAHQVRTRAQDHFRLKAHQCEYQYRYGCNLSW